MYSFTEIAIVNAVMIVPLALLAEGAGRVFRRPALTHLLWVLILIKLITPPLWRIPLIDRDLLHETARRFTPSLLTQSEFLTASNSIDEYKNNLRDSQTNGTVSQPSATKRPRPRTLADQDRLIAIRKNYPIAIATQWIQQESTHQIVFSILIGIWGVGGMAWFGVQGLRCIRFRRALTRGTAAPVELQDFSNQFAKRLRILNSPSVWLMPGVMSPMLWGNGNSTRLIFPEQLLDRLDQESIGTLLTHELCHYRRRDHWVRVLALMVTGFFWWHPVVWWARREIEAVEEECCDALVITLIKSPPKRYAEAILETVDFLADLSLRLPPLATGLSQFPFLRQRLTWIMRGPRKQDLSYCGIILLFLLISFLPVQPTWSTMRKSSPEPVRRPSYKVPRIQMTPTPAQPLPNSEPDEENKNGLTTIQSKTQLESSTILGRWPGFEVRSHSFDNRFIFLWNNNNQILLDVQTGRDFDLTPYDIISIAFSPDTHQFATIDGDRFLRLWDAEICDFQTWQVPGASAKSVDISSGGRWIATGGRDGIVRIWSVARLSPIIELPRETSSANSVRFSADGEMLAIATGDQLFPQSGRIVVFNTRDWTERISMNWNTPGSVVTFRSDSESLISGDWSGRIARWSISTGELLGMLDGQKELVAAAEFSLSGSSLDEIEIPDLDPNTNWSEPQPSQHFRWILDRWSVSIPTNPKLQATPTESPKSAKGQNH